MSGIPDNFPMSLRAWPTKEGTTSALPTLISRINAERGEFRNLTEEDLLEEIARDENETTADNEETNTEDEVEAVRDRLKEVMDAKAEMLAQLEQAHHASMVALDFVALLLSKDQPVQAGLSISDGLRQVVSLGTLGADRVKDTRLTDSRKKDNRAVSKGWKIQSFNTSVEAILTAASRLETEIAAETKYWESILAVDEKGWKTCKLPYEQHTLGVRFGFFDAAPAFSSRSLAALRRRADGTAYLDQGTADPTPKRVLVSVETNGTLSGSLAPEIPAPDDAPLETLILRARNSIFEEELWQELNREARTLANHGVRMTGDEITCQLTPSTRIHLRLEPLSTSTVVEPAEPLKHDDVATMVSLTLHLHLSHAHRQNQGRRTQPPPPLSSQPRLNPPYALLRPLLAYQHHVGVVSALRATTSSLAATLSAAAIAVPPATLLPTPPTPTTTTDERVTALLSSREAEFVVPLPADQLVTVKLRTDLGIQTRFRVEISPGIAALCRAPPNPSVEEVRMFLSWAASCAVVRAVVEKGEEGEGVGEGLRGWRETARPCLLRKEVEGKMKEVKVSIKADRVELNIKNGRGGWSGVVVCDEKARDEGKGVWEVVEEAGKSEGTDGVPRGTDTWLRGM